MFLLYKDKVVHSSINSIASAKLSNIQISQALRVLQGLTAPKIGGLCELFHAETNKIQFWGVVYKTLQNL